MRVGRGYPIGDDGVWLDGHTTNPEVNAKNRCMSIKFGKRRLLLATSLRLLREECNSRVVRFSTCPWAWERTCWKGCRGVLTFSNLVLYSIKDYTSK